MIFFTAEEITSLVNGELIGACTDKIHAPEQIEKAKNGNVTFIGSSKYARLWENSNASIAIVYKNINILPGEGKAFIKVENPDLAMASLLEALSQKPLFLN